MYQAIAAFYNNNIGDTNYDHMANFLHEVFYEYNKTGNSDEKPIVLDAGCGTGSCAVKLADKGFDVIGLDISPEMLQKAQEQPGSDKVQWICQDMTDMDLFGTVQAVFSMTDSVNHLLEEEELQGFFNGASLFTEKVLPEFSTPTIMAVGKLLLSIRTKLSLIELCLISEVTNYC